LFFIKKSAAGVTFFYSENFKKIKVLLFGNSQTAMRSKLNLSKALLRLKRAGIENKKFLN